jgi:catechol 2,3-dioxygenase-like lactoylglutathione lyase family enzyme
MADAEAAPAFRHLGLTPLTPDTSFAKLNIIDYMSTRLLEMTVIALDHFTVRTPKLVETCEFFEQVAGLKVGPRPPFPFDGRWLYQGEWPAVHLAVNDTSDHGLKGYLGDRQVAAGGGSGVVDHIAFRCKDLPAFEAKLRGLRKAYRGRTVPAQREHQVFVVDPNGMTIEFIFNSSETASWDGSGEYAPPTAA